jgi:hypothetical protein
MCPGAGSVQGSKSYRRPSAVEGKRTKATKTHRPLAPGRPRSVLSQILKVLYTYTIYRISFMLCLYTNFHIKFEGVSPKPLPSGGGGKSATILFKGRGGGSNQKMA